MMRLLSIASFVCNNVNLLHESEALCLQRRPIVANNEGFRRFWALSAFSLGQQSYQKISKDRLRQWTLALFFLTFVSSSF